MEILYMMGILITHYIADFWVQTHEQSQNKSSSLLALSLHVLTYALCISMLSALYGFIWKNVLLVFILTYVTHWLTDFITSKAAKLEFERKNIRTGFQIVGADQLIHYITLFLTFKYLI